MFEGQMVLADDRLQFAVDGELRGFRATGAADIGAPGGQLLAALGDGEGLVVGHVIHLAAEGVEGGHAVAFGFGQQDERQRQIRRALPRDRPALLHGSGLGLGRAFRADGRQAAGFSEGRVAWAVSVAGAPPVAAFLRRGRGVFVAGASATSAGWEE